MSKVKEYPISSPAIPCQLALTGDADEMGRVPFEGLARSMEPVRTWWGPLYHDFDGMQFQGPIALDYCHLEDVDMTMGFIERVEVKADGLHVFGFLTPEEGDETDKLLKKARKGVPYQMSIDYRGPMVVESVDDGASSTVNGKQVSGDCEIVREWTLTRVALCLTGKDRNTSAVLSEDDTQQFITFLNGDSDMPQASAIETVEQLTEQHPTLVKQLTDKAKAEASVEFVKAQEPKLSEARKTGHNEGILAERERCKSIFALCDTANLPGSAQQLIADGTSQDAAKDVLMKQLADKNQAPPADLSGNTADKPDPDAQYKAEYEANRATNSALGISEEDYVLAAKANAAKAT